MATIRAYTTIEQSRKLAEILPLESADMYWFRDDTETPKIYPKDMMKDSISVTLPCWSLAALLDIASTYCSRLETTLRADKNYNIFAVSGDFVFRSFDDFPNGFDNLVDACYEVIIKLYEVKML